MPNAIGKRRLLKLADMLEADAKNRKGMKFNIGTLGYVEDENSDPGLNCGTEGCAMGLAAISGKFKRAGLSYTVNCNYLNVTMHGQSKTYIDAAVKLFDITYREASILFSPGSYVTTTGSKGERKVAKRIRKIVAGKPISDDFGWI